jgi:hypothetical protein
LQAAKERQLKEDYDRRLEERERHFEAELERMRAEMARMSTQASAQPQDGEGPSSQAFDLLGTYVPSYCPGDLLQQQVPGADLAGFGEDVDWTVLHQQFPPATQPPTDQGPY